MIIGKVPKLTQEDKDKFIEDTSWTNHPVWQVSDSEKLEVPPEFEDYKQVMIPGAEKHGPNSWLTPDGPKTSFKQMHDSMFHHLAESFASGRYEGTFQRTVDKESRLDPLLHLICRAQMMYTRLKRGIKHEDDN